MSLEQPNPAPAVAAESVRMLQVNSLLNGGGTDHRSLQLAAGLHARGHTVALAGPDGRRYADYARQLGVRVIPSDARKRSRILTTARVLRRERFQILQAHHGRDYWPAVLAAHLSGVRPAVVLVRHLAKSPSSWFSRWFLLTQCAAMVAISDFVARVLRSGVYEPDSPEPERRHRPPMRGNHSRIRVIRGAFDLHRFQPTEGSPARASWGMEPNHFVFGVVGTYPPPRGKGQREFLRAAAQIKTAVPQARFAIVGRGRLRPVLEADIRKLGLQDQAVITPWSDAMPEVMNALDCLVHPQVGTEALPGVVIEAHACGKPVIATTIDGNPEAFGPGGLGRLVPPESVDALATAMSEVAQHRRLTVHERWVVHRRVEAEYSTDMACRRYEALYRSLLRSPTATGLGG